jgi:hypothetical protein
MNSNSKRYLISSIVSFFMVIPWLLIFARPINAQQITSSQTSKSHIFREGNILISGGTILRTPDSSLINGLFTPNSSDIFFQEGREKFDREIKILLDNRLAVSENLLEIQDDIFQQQQELENNFQLDITPSQIKLQ